MKMPWQGLFQTDGYHPGEIEDSLLLRVLVFITIGIAIGATAQATQSDLWLPALGIAGSLAGSWISWVRRRSKNWWIKLILALLMMVAMASFFNEISDNPYDARLPLAHLLIWLQVLHSFDLPRRKDVFYTLWVALILISVAATTSRDIGFGLFVGLYAIFSVASLIASHLSSQGVRAAKGFWTRLTLPVLGLTLGLAAVTFLVMPHYEGMQVQTFPVSIHIQSVPFFDGQIKNQSYPTRSGNTSDAGTNIETQARRQFDPNAYYGFTTQLDLNYRGKLSDEIVMRVRSSRESYWRGMAFDVYDGQRWKMTRPFKLRRLSTAVLPIWIRETRELKKNVVRRERVIQTYYIERDQSNLIFKAPYAEQIFFPTDYVLMDDYGGLRSPIELFADTTYTVISEIPEFDPQSLAKVSWKQVEAARRDPSLAVEPAYYTMPAIPARVGDLARRVAARTTGPYAAVKALESYLKLNYPYDLDIPEFPLNRDSIDYFLFEQKAGYCEHFASSLAIMARSLGLATRFVTGYIPGQYNPMTGYFDVRSSDAHGWVEVYFPHHGWVPFDPTPGFTANLHQQNYSQQSSGRSLLDYLRQILPANLTRRAGESFEAVLKGLVWFFSLVIGALTWLPLPTLSLLAGISILALLGWVYWHRRRPAAPAFVPQYATDPEKKAFVEAYLALLAELNQRFDLTVAAETPREQQDRLLPLLTAAQAADLQALTADYYTLRYADEPLLQDRLAQARTRLQTLRRTGETSVKR